MKIDIESTTDVVDHNGGLARIWHGVTENGIRCSLLVAEIVVHEDENQEQFLHELMETTKLNSPDGPWDMRMFSG